MKVTRYRGRIQFVAPYHESKFITKSCIRRQSPNEDVLVFEFDEYFVTINLRTMSGRFKCEGRHWYCRGVIEHFGTLNAVVVQKDNIKAEWVEEGLDYHFDMALEKIEELQPEPV